MINQIKLKFGTQDKMEHLAFDVGAVTIFVGPNNSGKSLLLREIEQYSLKGKQSNMRILEEVNFQLPDDESLGKDIEKMSVPYGENENAHPGFVKYGRFNSTSGFKVHHNRLEDLIIYKNTPQGIQNFIQGFVSMYVSRFGGKERFQLIQNKDNADLKRPPQNSLTSLFQDDEKRKKVSDLIFEAFKKYFVIDPTSMRHLEIRLSDVLPASSEIERGWTKESVAFHKNATSITAFSDGVQAFTGLAMTVIAGEEKIMLIDEPEAFLHPSLANLLGRKLSEEMTGREGNLIVSTHSPFFVMGCLQSGRPMNIVRLTYSQSNASTAKLLGADKVVELFRNPLLRSTGVLQALFHSSVIVSESDADRAFYNEINERLVHEGKGRGLADVLFLNAQNKQTVWNIVEPLRKMGIPAVGIVDLDFVKDGGAEFIKALRAVNIPDELHTSFSDMRSKTKENFNKTGKDMKRDGGMALLTSGELALAEKLLSDLSEYGLFIVPYGELESWLKPLNCTGHGPSWLNQMLNKLGADPEDAGYVKPETGDVWDFLSFIQKWVSNPKRKGIET